LLKLSIITPVFNLIKSGREDLFLQTLQSVADQTYSNIEHVIADGASSDGTMELIGDFERRFPAIRVHSEKDRNLYDALNKGAALASGDYLMFLNSDDYLSDPKIVSVLVDALANGADFACGGIRKLGENDAFLADEKPNPEVFLTRMPFSTQALMVKKGVFLELGGFDLDFDIAGDYDFILRMMIRTASFAQVPETVAVFREGGISYDFRLRRDQMIAIWKKNYSQFGDVESIDFDAVIEKRRLPLSLLSAMLRAPDVNDNLLRAARRERLRSIRRLLLPGISRPWRAVKATS
jgi:glycosyltransferase involved in cell wall biosynthesis